MRVKTDNVSKRYFSKDISAGGVFLLTDELLSEETKVDLEILLPNISAPVKAKGEVVWGRRKEPCGFAVKFTEITDLSREFIRWAISK